MATMTDEKKSMTELEGWIEQLMECKQLSENQVCVMQMSMSMKEGQFQNIGGSSVIL